MRRVAAGFAGWVVASGASGAWADPPPPLAPPVLTPPALEAPAEAPAPTVRPKPKPADPPKEADHSPVLVIPGVTTPRPGSRPKPAAPGRATTSTSATLPALVGPADTPPSDPLAPPPYRNTQRPAAGADSRDRRSIPFTLESEPEGDDGVRPLPSPRRGPSVELERPTSVPPQNNRRPQGFFGRFLPPGPLDRNAADRRGVVTVEPRTDPAVDAATRRRIESQIRNNLDGRLRQYEVRVVGREVTIRAQSARFWQRRANRHALETLPALSGYKTTILVDE